MLYKAVVHTVLLYVSESWVITGAIIKVLVGGGGQKVRLLYIIFGLFFI